MAVPVRRRRSHTGIDSNARGSPSPHKNHILWQARAGGGPFRAQDGVDQGIFVDGAALFIIDKSGKLPQQPFPAHAEAFAEFLRGQIVFLDIGVNSSGLFLVEEEGEVGSAASAA